MLQLPINSESHNSRMSRSCTRKKPFTFISNILKKKKILKFEDIAFDKEMNYRARSEPSVSTYSCSHKCKRKKTPSASTLSLTPTQDRFASDDIEAHRLRNGCHISSQHCRPTIRPGVSEQYVEFSGVIPLPGHAPENSHHVQVEILKFLSWTLPSRISQPFILVVNICRVSRNDNPFIQKVLTSRESMLDCTDDTESDDAILILMSQDFQDSHTEADPLSLPQVHEHMIRSPPPAFWPRSPRNSVFNFSNNADQEDNGNTSGSNDGNQLSFKEGILRRTRF